MTLSTRTLVILAGWQQAVDAKFGYLEQVAEGKRLFNRKRNLRAFKPVLKTLDRMCSGARRCCYCEDSQATDVDHIWPKDCYPHLVFAWENYLFGCARCNRYKSNACEIYAHDNGVRLSVTAFVKVHRHHPPAGDALLINPRLEDPMALMLLDLQDTFFFLPTASQGTREWERADHTIRLLRLNEEDVLPKARKEAYGNYMDRLEKYINHKRENKHSELPFIIETLKGMRHPTVWHEMKRQAMFDFRQPLPQSIQDIKDLFAAAPEALDW